ncbi:MAG TPA: DoxX family protein [Chloroflexota bacterium]|nr:DoxX family protein [Chloroflexota bacterium]
MKEDVGILAARVVTGGLLAGHGAQKLFGVFEGPGRKGTAGMMESMGLRPGEHWGLMAGMAEFTGGTLTALGFLNPLGPIGVMSAMAMATGTVHWGKPVWVTKGGAELPLSNAAIALALAVLGPGRFSLDRALRLRVPGWLVGGALVSAGEMVAAGLFGRPAPGQTAAA